MILLDKSVENLLCVTLQESLSWLPGERIIREIVDYIQFAKERGCSLQGTEDPEVNHINVIKRKEN